MSQPKRSKLTANPSFPSGSTELVSRWLPAFAAEDRTSISPMAILGLAGVSSALAVAFLPFPVRLPGHAILKATLPIMLGLSIVRRPLAGTMASLVAGVCMAGLAIVGSGRVQPAAVVGMLAIGPLVDWAIRIQGPRASCGWTFARIASAGVAANMVSFGLRWLSSGGPRLHHMKQLGWGAFLSFAICGLAAGLISAAICFRLRPVAE